MMSPADVVAFWNGQGYNKWFARDAALDAAIMLHYTELHMQAARGELSAWEESAEGSLALLLLLDQFPRNLYRGTGHAFATDGLARAVARRALAAGFDRQVEATLAIFFYLPFEHSEDPTDQELSVRLFTEHRDRSGDERTLPYAIEHRDIIARFGRFPHRNAALGRETTPEEQNYLDDGGFQG